MRHVRRRPSGHEVVTDVGSPTPGPDLPGRRRVPGSEPARPRPGRPAPQEASPPRGPAPHRATPQPLAGSAATAPELPWPPEQLLGWVSLPSPSWDLGREHPGRPRWAAPWPCSACSGPSGNVKALLGLLLRFSLGGSAPQFLSLSFIPCLCSQASPLQAWAGSGGAGVTSCSNTPTVWP